jgi:hypothetical protein
MAAGLPERTTCAPPAALDPLLTDPLGSTAICVREIVMLTTNANGGHIVTPTKQRTRRAQPGPVDLRAPAPAGCQPHERASWLSALPESPWLTELRDTHVQLAHEWADACEAIADAREDYVVKEAAYRREVRDALAVGEPAPPRPDGLDPAVREATVTVAREDAELARDALNAHVLICLATLREHRQELELGTLDPTLIRALASGGGRALQTEKLRRELANLEEPYEPLIEDVSDQEVSA